MVFLFRFKFKHEKDESNNRKPGHSPFLIKISIMGLLFFYTILFLRNMPTSSLDSNVKIESPRRLRTHIFRNSRETKEKRKVFVNFVYSENGPRKDSKANLAFFLKHGATVPDVEDLDVDYGITVNGECKSKECASPELFLHPNTEGEIPNLLILNRANLGFDFGAHSAMLEELDKLGKTNTYDVFIFLNDGVTGPITPSYMPKRWHWTQAFSDRMPYKDNPDSKIGLVGTSIVCLPDNDLGGIGPRVEGFAFGITRDALDLVRTKGTSYRQHETKEKAIIDGEYNLSKLLLDHNIHIDSLLKSYQEIDWNDKKNWKCNQQMHPTRKDSYFGSSINPMEVIFHKALWANKEPVNLDVLKKYVAFQEESLNRSERKRKIRIQEEKMSF